MSGTATIWVSDAGAPTGHAIGAGCVVVGRDDGADLRLGDQGVSGRHAELRWDGRRLWIQDLGSRNGTTVNGEATVGRVELSDGDLVGFGPAIGRVDIDLGATMVPAAQPDGSSSGRLVFVSHSSEDKREVRELADRLRRRGWNVWIDEVGIAGGKDFRRELFEALQSCWVVVLVVSAHSMASKWVRREIDVADERGVPIVPVLLEAVSYPDSLEFTLGGVHRLDASGLRDSDGLAAQIDSIDRALRGATRAGPPPERGRIRIAIGTLLLVVGVLGLLGGFAAFVVLSQQSLDAGPGAETTDPVVGWGVFMASMPIVFAGGVLLGSGQRARK